MSASFWPPTPSRYFTLPWADIAGFRPVFMPGPVARADRGSASLTSWSTANPVGIRTTPLN